MIGINGLINDASVRPEIYCNIAVFTVIDCPIDDSNRHCGDMSIIQPKFNQAQHNVSMHKT